MSDGGGGRGLFLVVEGGEGAGKSTQVARLAEWLESLDRPHVIAREPGGTALGEAVRSVVLERGDLDVPPVAELLLMLAARAAFVDDVVRPALEAGRVVVADRYDLSTLAYQGYGRGLDLSEVRRVNALATDGLRPDLYLVLDVDPDTGRERQRRSGKAPDRMEGSGTDFHRRVALAYRELAAADPRAALVPGDGTPDAVQESVRRLLEGRFPETFRPGAR